MKITFYIVLFFVAYTYVLYPLIIILFSKLSPKNVHEKNELFEPYVSVIIAAKNEEKNILKRLENLVEQTYSSDKYEIIIVSDGSTDSTNQLVSEYVTNTKESMVGVPAIKLLALEENHGKPTAINQGIKVASGEIIVFSDARQKFENNVIEKLVSNYVDPRVGAVSGELYFIEDDDSEVRMQMGLYWKYEKAIRRSESVVSSVVGVTGAIYSIRKELYEDIPSQALIDDVIVPMAIVLKGYRVLFDSSASAYDIVSKDSKQEWRRKVRTLAGNWQLISLMPTLYNPLKNPIFLQFMSHKVFRTLVPFCLPVIFLLSAIIPGKSYGIFCLLQIAGYGLAILGHMYESLRANKIIGFSYFFVVMNLAAIAGFWYWITGKSGMVWQPAYKEQ